MPLLAQEVAFFYLVVFYVIYELGRCGTLAPTLLVKRIRKSLPQISRIFAVLGTSGKLAPTLLAKRIRKISPADFGDFADWLLYFYYALDLIR
jgi:hypothetical protein